MDIWKCKFCDKEIVLKNKFSKSGHLAKCRLWKEFKNNNITEEFLRREYVDLKRSAIEIANDIGLDSATAIISILKKYKIHVRGIKEDRNFGITTKKQEKTNLKRYGVKNVLSRKSPFTSNFWEDVHKRGFVNPGQLPEVKEKILETFDKKYGGHPVKTEEVKKKIKETMFQKYGMHISQLPRIKLQKTKTMMKNFGVPNVALLTIKNKFTKPHKKVCDILKKMEKVFKIEQFIHPYIVDVLVGKNHIIEIYGDYWHCNPLIYKKGDILNFPGRKVRPEEIWERDKKRQKYLEENFLFLSLWENDINKNPEKVETILCEFLK